MIYSYITGISVFLCAYSCLVSSTMLSSVLTGLLTHVHLAPETAGRKTYQESTALTFRPPPLISEVQRCPEGPDFRSMCSPTLLMENVILHLFSSNLWHLPGPHSQPTLFSTSLRGQRSQLPVYLGLPYPTCADFVLSPNSRPSIQKSLPAPNPTSSTFSIYWMTLIRIKTHCKIFHFEGKKTFLNSIPLQLLLRF